MKHNTTIVVLLSTLFLCIFLFGLFDAIVPLGRFIPQENLTADYFWGVAWALVLGASIFVWPVRSEDKKSIFVAWIVRCLVTLVFMLVYEFYFDNDAYVYFYVSTRPYLWEWTGLRLGGGTDNLWRLAWMHAQVLPDSYHLMKVSFSMVGFIASHFFYRAAVRFLGREDIRVFFALSLFPSILFWSSTVGKDPVVLLGISIYVYGVATWHSLNRNRYILVMLFGIWISMAVRIWLGPILLAPLAVFGVSRMRGALSKLLFIGAIVAAFLFTAGRFQEQFRIENSQDLVSSIDRMAHSTGWDGGSGRQTGGSFSSLGQLIAFAPVGVFTALFRPLPGEVLSVFGWLAGFESLALLWMLAQALKRSGMSDLKDPRLLWAVVLILTWSTIYGFISSQNLGGAVRFRLQILPMLLGTLLYLRRDRRGDNAYARE